ncbi:uncharacterized protein LOC134259070 [Saccostrea cucullata]|uniref:uncharacterized protein LOC134259070 n=1 Tax=Saccostrea cuccullata TaxID=36930 RepID=UPI002ED35DB1
MATSLGKPCEICLKPITDIKYYRSLGTEASKVYSALLDELNIDRKGYACKFCVNKLNRLIRLDEEIRTKLDVLKQKRGEIFDDLKKVTCNRPSSSVASSSSARPNSSLQTPVKKNSKREYKIISKTPTPRKFKARRILPLASPCSKEVKERDTYHAEPTARKSTTVDSSTQTKTTEEKDFAVKIIVKYGSNYRSRIINSEVQKSVCKAILNNRNPATYIKSLTKDDQFKSALLDCLCKEIRKEVCSLCRKDETLLKYDNNIKWRNILSELVLKAPSIVRIFQSIVSKDVKKSSSQYTNNLCTALSILLYGRNHQLSQIQYVVGFVLDQCGATKEAISILHDMGVSVTQSTIHKKKRVLVKQQEDKIKETAKAYTEQRKLILLGEAVINSDSQRKEEVLPSVYNTSNYADLDILSAKSKLHILSNGCGATYSGCETTALYDSCLEQYSTCTANTPVTFLTESKKYYSSTDNSVKHCEISIDSSCIIPTGTFSSEIYRYSTASHEKSMERLKKEVNKAKQNPVKAIEVLGDNLDLLVSPGDMTSDRQRKSWHWFLVLLTQKRITAPDLPSSGKVADILHLEASSWLPSNEEILRYRHDLQIHVAKILVKNFAALKHLDKVLPKYIPHEYVEITKQKTVFYNSDLIDASENSTEGMIHILQKVHDLVVPHCVVDSKEVCEPVVFGGDVLTNERAYGAQMAMFNNKSEFKNLLGVIHRPEGLHRQMNFLLVTLMPLHGVQLQFMLIF